MTRTICILTLLATLSGGLVLSLWAQSSRQGSGGRTRAGASEDEPRRSRGRRRGPSRISPELEEEILAVLKEKRPRVYEQLNRLRERNSRRYRWVLSEHARWYRRYQNLPEPVQKAMLAQYDQRMRIYRLRKSLDNANLSESRIETLRKELREAVGMHFDASQVIRKHTLSQLQQRLERFREEIESRDEKRDEVIERELAQILANPAPVIRPLQTPPDPTAGSSR
jgi:hypothetical protein